MKNQTTEPRHDPRGVPPQAYPRCEPAQPVEQPLADKLRELHSWLDQAGNTLAEVHDKLLGARPVGECGGKTDCTPSIEEMVATAATKAACLVGQAETINQRL